MAGRGSQISSNWCDTSHGAMHEDAEASAGLAGAGVLHGTPGAAAVSAIMTGPGARSASASGTGAAQLSVNTLHLSTDSLPTSPPALRLHVIQPCLTPSRLPVSLSQWHPCSTPRAQASSLIRQTALHRGG